MQGTVAGLPTDKCPLWETPAKVWSDSRFNNRSVSVDSDRAGGPYVLLIHIASLLRSPSCDLSNKAKTQITTWLVDRRREGTEIPEITQELVDRARNGELRSLSPIQKANRLLQYLGQLIPEVGVSFQEHYVVSRHDIPAYCEAIDEDEVRELLIYLAELSYIAGPPRSSSLKLKIQGHQRILELEQTNVHSQQIFVAMWFDESVNSIYDDAIKVAIEEAGCTPCRVDKPENEHKGTYEMKVCDRIEVEIRRSRLVIADFTHGDEGARGGVYYEAGLARGLGIPVIWTCREDMFKNKLHFDTRQYPHIGWKQDDLSRFKQQLMDRIELLTKTT